MTCLFRVIPDPEFPGVHGPMIAWCTTHQRRGDACMPTAIHNQLPRQVAELELRIAELESNLKRQSKALEKLAEDRDMWKRRAEYAQDRIDELEGNG